jgi:hypothetical protein
MACKIFPKYLEGPYVYFYYGFPLTDRKYLFMSGSCIYVESGYVH